MLMNRTELFQYHSVFDLKIDNEHYYVYNLPYYNNVYAGRHIYPDGDKFYRITPEIYIQLITLRNKNCRDCQSYIENEIDNYLIDDKRVSGFEYIDDKKNYMGSQSSAVLQAVIAKCHSKWTYGSFWI